jgi:phytoene dehydrogenase-like protein
MQDMTGNSRLENRYDAVVIGSGMGGLTAAATLARGGARVLLLEQHNLPGGFSSSFVRGRFEFEVSLHVMTEFGPAHDKGPVRIVFEDELNMTPDEIEFVNVPEAYRMITDDGAYNVVVPFDRQGFMDAILGVSPDAGKPLEEYLRICREIGEGYEYVFSTGYNPDVSVLRAKYRTMLATVGYTLDDINRKLGLPRAAADILNSYWCYLGMPADRQSFMIYAAMIDIFLQKGAYVPRRTSFEMSTVLEKKIRDYGGSIEFNTRVEKILVEGKRVTGVVTSKGEHIMTSHVLSNASPHAVYGSMVHPADGVPAKARRLTHARRPGSTAMVVYMGLDVPPEKLNIENYSYFIAPHVDTKRLYDECNVLRPDGPFYQAVVCPNIIIPDYSPPGTSVVTSTILFGPDAWSGVTPETYHETKRAVAASIIRQLGRALKAPLEDHIEEIEIATPQTFSRFTGGFKGGIYGYEQDLWDSITVRQALHKDELFIRGLEFVGGYSFMGHGYSPSIMSGNTAAKAVLHELKAG